MTSVSTVAQYAYILSGLHPAMTSARLLDIARAQPTRSCRKQSLDVAVMEGPQHIIDQHFFPVSVLCGWYK